MKQVVLILVVILLFNCTNEKSKFVAKNKEIEVYIGRILDKLNINAKVDVVKDSKYGNGLVEISFKKPHRIIGFEFQDILVSYIAYHVFNEYELNDTLGFIYYLDEEELTQQRILSYNIEKIKKLQYEKKLKFLKLLEYCFLNFKSGDDVGFNINIKSINKIVPTITKTDTLFKLLLQLTEEEKPSLKNNADIIFITFFEYDIYILKKNAKKMSKLKKEQRESELKYIENFWRIAKNRDIYKEGNFYNETLRLKERRAINGNGTD